MAYVFGAFTYDEVENRRSTSHLLVAGTGSQRLPFEAILRPYEHLTTPPQQGGANDLLDSYEHPSQAGIYIRRKKNQFFLMNPSYYKDYAEFDEDTMTTISGNYNKYNFPYFEINTRKQNKDFRYELAMNNFLSEATAFFIRDGRLTSLVSKAQNEFGAFVSGSTYAMDVVLKKDEQLKVVNSPGQLGGRYFGPPHSFIKPSSNGEPYMYNQLKQAVADPAYAPYTPPYFYGESRARVTFIAHRTSTQNDPMSLQEILDRATIVDIPSEEIESLFINKAQEVTRISADGTIQESTSGSFRESSAWQEKMPLSSSFELKGVTKKLRVESAPDGRATTLSSPEGTNLDTWVIYPKFECPILNFKSDHTSESALKRIDEISIETKVTQDSILSGRFLPNPIVNSEEYTVDKRAGSGIWAGYGKSDDDRFVTVSVERVKEPGINDLSALCGFSPGEQKRIGRVANKKEITEAVVMIPFLDEAIESEVFFANAFETLESSSKTTKVDDRNFIKVSRGAYDRQKNALDSGELEKSTTITDMIQGMRKYNIPPLYDFEQFGGDPFAMYFFEFKHELDKEDLTNIWQGIQPKMAKQAKLDSIEISHEINSDEFFGNFREVPEGVRWMVFKVKRKAEKNYYNLTQDSKDDSRFKFDFDIGTKEPEYGYNYPYDYFTMLEMIQVEAKVQNDTDPSEYSTQSSRSDDGEE